MAERTNAQLLKSCEVQASVGSNPTPSAHIPLPPLLWQHVRPGREPLGWERETCGTRYLVHVVTTERLVEPDEAVVR